MLAEIEGNARKSHIVHSCKMLMRLHPVQLVARRTCAFRFVQSL